LNQWANILLQQGLEDEVKSDVWPVIKFDLKWITEDWETEGCDLWEEVRSNDFYWARISYVKA